MENKNKSDIINELANNKIVENIIFNITHTHIADLAQDVYLTLLEKNEELITSLYEKNELNYFITKIILNNLFSTTSPYYYNYKKHNKTTVDIEDVNNI